MCIRVAFSDNLISCLTSHAIGPKMQFKDDTSCRVNNGNVLFIYYLHIIYMVVYSINLMITIKVIFCISPLILEFAQKLLS